MGEAFVGLALFSFFPSGAFRCALSRCERFRGSPEIIRSRVGASGDSTSNPSEKRPPFQAGVVRCLFADDGDDHIMTTLSKARSAGQWLSMSAGVAAAAYATYAGVTWLRYGQASPPAPENQDALLDRFMPVYDIAERHRIRVAAPAEITFMTACKTDLRQSPIARVIFRAREVILGSEPDTAARPHGLLALTKSLGWRVLAEVPGREVVMGAVTRPWEANVTFRGVPPDEFAAFDEAGYVKIAWTLRADPLSPIESVFRTETRVIATDATARAKFRRYWSLVSPGIIAIRWVMLQPVKREAEREALCLRSR